MATKVIMPALGMAQETGKLLAWLKEEGETVTKGEPLMEIETDKAAVEYESSAAGILSGIRIGAGQDVPVGEVIAWLLEPGEEVPQVDLPVSKAAQVAETIAVPDQAVDGAPPAVSQTSFEISPVARNMAQEHGISIDKIKPNGNRIEKSDILAYIEQSSGNSIGAGMVLASPKARRLAGEHGIALEMISGSGPDGAVLAADVLAQAQKPQTVSPSYQSSADLPDFEMSKAWTVMAERLAEAWRTIPHFYLQREINASQMIVWREAAQQKSETKITFTDLLVKATAIALKLHPRVNAAWINNSIQINNDVHVGLAVATDDGLVVPVIHHTDSLSVDQIALQRKDIVARALEGKPKMQDLQDGTFTISNLGMYKVDSFNAIVNPPQAAILAVGKIQEKAIPIEGQIEILPTMPLNLSCDHRVVDGARGAKFLDTLANYLEEPLSIL